MTFQLDKDWRLQPIKGATGQTYMGIRATEKVFIKRNTSPLLAALSKEGIAPKMVWTKRTANGDVLTAQEWLEGQLLRETEIGSRNDVIDVLYHLHHSKALKNMLGKIGGHVQTPAKLLAAYQQSVPEEFLRQSYFNRSLSYLSDNIPEYPEADYCVVHGDVNHRNWLVSSNYLYLVDWDSVMLADPAMDLGMLLGHYVPRKNWHNWLLAYGVQPEQCFMERLDWYVVYNFLQEILRYYHAEEKRGMNTEILKLRQLFNY